MRVLVVGGGGREHAIIRRLKESRRVTQLFALPGNAGISQDAASCRRVSPAAAVDQALSALDPDRTDEKATRYWALGFGHGAAPAEASPAPVRQRQGNRSALCSFELQAPTKGPHTVKARSAG